MRIESELLNDLENLVEKLKRKEPQPRKHNKIEPKSKNRTMGLPAEFNNCVMARKFRWTLQSKRFQEFVVSALKIDHVQNILEIVFLDCASDDHKFEALTWLNNLQNAAVDGDKESLLFTTYDGCGNELYQMSFEGLKLLSHETELNYADSDVLSRTAKIGFQRNTLTIPAKKPNPSITPFSIKASDFNERMTQFLAKNPVSLEETKVNFLNTSCCIPGRTIR